MREPQMPESRQQHYRSSSTLCSKLAACVCKEVGYRVCLVTCVLAVWCFCLVPCALTMWCFCLVTCALTVWCCYLCADCVVLLVQRAASATREAEERDDRRAGDETEAAEAGLH